MDQVEALINLVVILSWWSIAMSCVFLLAERANTLRRVVSTE
jgi:hypothetical protein